VSASSACLALKSGSLAMSLPIAASLISILSRSNCCADARLEATLLCGSFDFAGTLPGGAASVQVSAVDCECATGTPGGRTCQGARKRQPLQFPVH